MNQVSFDLRKNNFFILGISPRDRKDLLTERIDILLSDGELTEEVASKIQRELSGSKTRLISEVAWLLEISPSRALQIASQFFDKTDYSFNELLKVLDEIGNLSSVNLAAHFCSLKLGSPEIVQSLIKSWNDLSVEHVRNSVNESRQVSSYPSVTDDLVKDALSELKQTHAETALRCIVGCKHPGLALSKIVEDRLNLKHSICPFLESIIEKYEGYVIPKLKAYEEEISSTFDKIKSLQSPSVYKESLNNVLSTLKNWDEYSQPLQLVHQSKGLDEPRAKRVFEEVRDIIIWLANEKNEYAVSLDFSKSLMEIFPELPASIDKLQKDVDTLTGLVEKANANQAEREKELSLKLDLGWGKTFICTPEYISYANKSFELSKIDRTRWGIFILRTNGIPHHYYTIWFGTQNQHTKIECAKTFFQIFRSPDSTKEQYEAIIQRLWKGVIIRQRSEVLAKLKDKQQIDLCDLKITSDGIELRRKKFLSTEPVFCRWHEMTIGAGAGFFQITHKEDPKVVVQLSYRDVWNVHLLEAVMRFLWKDGNHSKLAKGALF